MTPGVATNFFQEPSVLISSDKGISLASFADANGGCAAPFLPTNLMKTKYAVNIASDFVAFASKQAGIIDVYSPGQEVGVDTPVETLTLTRTGSNTNAPYKARKAATPIGYRFISTVPMAGWYQPANDNGGARSDETILYGAD
jgi:hypothetical protein